MHSRFECWLLAWVGMFGDIVSILTFSYVVPIWVLSLSTYFIKRARMKEED